MAKQTKDWKDTIKVRDKFIPDLEDWKVETDKRYFYQDFDADRLQERYDNDPIYAQMIDLAEYLWPWAKVHGGFE